MDSTGTFTKASADGQADFSRDVIGIPQLYGYDRGLGVNAVNGNRVVNGYYAGNPAEVQIFNNNRPSMGHVMVTLTDAQGHTSMSRGSGFFVDANGLMSTDNHVVNPASMVWEDLAKQKHTSPVASATITVITADKKVHQATVKDKDERTDLALLQVQPLGNETFKPVELGNSHLGPRQAVLALGYPLTSDNLWLSSGTTKLFGSDSTAGRFDP